MLSSYSRNRNINFNIQMGSVMLQRVNNVKYLGVMLDESITWSDQMSYLSKKLSRCAGIFSKLRYYVNKEVLIKIYHSLFNSHLQYAILCWGSANLTHLNKLQVLQNRAIRNISKAPRFFRLDNIYLNYRILKVKDLYNLEVCKFMHKHHNKSLPNCFNSFFSISQQRATRSSSNLNYNTPFYRSNKGQRSIKFYGPKIWNSIPLPVRNLSFIDIKKQYKNLILSKY